MFVITFVLLFHVLAITSKGTESKLDRYIVACRTTDFLCFKTQYLLLRDNILLGCKEMDISVYVPYMIQYSDTSTCVKVTGVEESELVGISVDSVKNQFSMTLAMPVRLQQMELQNGSLCKQPDTEFSPKGLHTGPLKKFAGNATVEVSYPYKLLKKKSEVFMKLKEENLDVILDIPDLSQYDKDSDLESKLYEWSEWAYDMVQHVDVAEHVVVPFTGQVKKLFEKVPLDRLILLYPSEEYSDMQFKYYEDAIPK